MVLFIENVIKYLGDNIGKKDCLLDLINYYDRKADCARDYIEIDVIRRSFLRHFMVNYLVVLEEKYI